MGTNGVGRFLEQGEEKPTGLLRSTEYSTEYRLHTIARQIRGQSQPSLKQQPLPLPVRSLRLHPTLARFPNCVNYIINNGVVVEGSL